MEDKKIEKIVDIIARLLEFKSKSHEELDNLIRQDLRVLVDFSNEDIEKIIYLYEKKFGTSTFDPSITIVENKSNDETWLIRKKRVMQESEHQYQRRYEKYLLSNRYSNSTIQSIVKEAEKVLSLCSNPDANEKKRGLVMGDVQSGKTSNYLALANLACDYGYKIILILTGTTESLRIQTQERVDEGIIGAISSTIGRKESITYTGVGVDEKKHYAIPFTTDLEDFTAVNCISSDFKMPQILVVKKNKRVLESVKKWLKPGQPNVSGNNILIIDDECDNASVNTRRPSKKEEQEEDPSTINRLIREIYNNFDCASYVGYTATPFANVFINPDSIKEFDDLFPSDFIHRLKSNSDIYFGIDKVFRNNSRHIKIIDEGEEYHIPAKHKKDYYPLQIPNSLKKAICTFLISNCIRTFREDDKKHRSMIINASPFTPVQERLVELVQDYVQSLKDIILQYDNTDRYLQDKEFRRIFDIYNHDPLFNTLISRYGREEKTIRDEISFESLKALLYDEISKFVVVIMNSKQKEDQRFNYKKYKETGARVIIVGGYMLSRGLTLEGLMTSYYNRNSSAYDTLLQMCRWFGYRPNYEDICTIYMSQNSFDCFGAVVEALDNFDSQLRVMEIQGETPKDFGLMVRESPETLETNLLITSRNKLYNSRGIEHVLNYSGVDIDTSKLFKDLEKNKSNLSAVQLFVKELSIKGKKIKQYEHGRYMIKDVSNTDLADLIIKLKIPLENKKFDVDNLTDFIRKGEYYKKWDIVFATGEDDMGEKFRLYDEDENECLRISPVKRSFTLEPDEDIIRISKNNNRLLEPGIFNAGLTEEQIEEAKELAKKRPSKKGASTKEYKAPIAKDYLSVRGRKPLFIILPIKLSQDKPGEESDYLPEKEELIKQFKNGDWVIGFGVGFAGTEGKVIHKFRINKIKLAEYSKRNEE